MKKGQSLVEMALALPLLIIMFIGVFEVGYLIRNYMVVLVANRDMVRVAIKDNYTLEDARRHFDMVLSGQVATDTLQVTVSEWQFAPMYPCDPEGWQTEPTENGDYWPTCNCEDLILWQTPLVTITGNLLELTPAYSEQLQLGNNTVECNIMKQYPKDMLRPEYNTVVVGEFIYTHHQLLGFPGLHLIDPIVIYDKYQMRKTVSGR